MFQRNAFSLMELKFAWMTVTTEHDMTPNIFLWLLTRVSGSKFYRNVRDKTENCLCQSRGEQLCLSARRVVVVV